MSDLSFERFLNALRIIKALDLPELQTAGVFVRATKAAKTAEDWDHWESFRDDPLRYLTYCDDAVARKIWTVVEARQPKEIAR